MPAEANPQFPEPSSSTSTRRRTRSTDGSTTSKSSSSSSTTNPFPFGVGPESIATSTTSSSHCGFFGCQSSQTTQTSIKTSSTASIASTSTIASSQSSSQSTTSSQSVAPLTGSSTGQSSHNSGITGGQIAAAVVVPIVVVIAIIIAVFFWLKRRKARRTETGNSRNGDDDVAGMNRGPNHRDSEPISLSEKSITSLDGPPTLNHVILDHSTTLSLDTPRLSPVLGTSSPYPKRKPVGSPATNIDTSASSRLPDSIVQPVSPILQSNRPDHLGRQNSSGTTLVNHAPQPNTIFDESPKFKAHRDITPTPKQDELFLHEPSRGHLWHSINGTSPRPNSDSRFLRDERPGTAKSENNEDEEMLSEFDDDDVVIAEAAPASRQRASVVNMMMAVTPPKDSRI